MTKMGPRGITWCVRAGLTSGGNVGGETGRENSQLWERGKREQEREIEKDECRRVGKRE